MKNEYRTCTLHIGMHKTGTSSIQKSLNGYDDGETLYCQFERPNHSVPMVTLFKKDPQSFRVHRQLGRTAEQVENLKLKFATQLEESIEKTRSQLLISGEALAQQLSPTEIAEMVSYFRSRFDYLRVIAYLRTFEDYAASAFQEYLKSGAVNFFVPAPDFRSRFEPWLDVLKPGEMEFVPYQTDTVTDFSRRVGVTLPPVQGEKANVSLSGPAMALLFGYNTKVEKPIFGDPERVKRYQAILGYLQTIPGSKFSFSQELLEDTAEEMSEDISWMEKIAGFSLRENKTAGPQPIASADDMLALARKSCGLLDESSAEGQALLELLCGRGSSTNISSARLLKQSRRNRAKLNFPLMRRPNLTLLDDYIVRTVVPPEACEVVVTFEAADQTIPRRDLRRPGFGEEFLLANGYAVVSILTNSPNWYRDAEIQDFLARPRFHSFLKNFEHVQCYGSSMGGYGACAFANLLGADNIVALQPVTTLRHDLVPWEERFQAKHVLDWASGSPYSDAIEGIVNCKSVYVFYDPDNEDAKHADRLNSRLAPNVLRAIHVKGAQHAVPRFLARQGILKDAVLMALQRKQTDGIRKLVSKALQDETK